MFFFTRAGSFIVFFREKIGRLSLYSHFATNGKIISETIRNTDIMGSFFFMVLIWESLQELLSSLQKLVIDQMRLSSNLVS